MSRVHGFIFNLLSRQIIKTSSFKLLSTMLPSHPPLKYAYMTDHSRITENERIMCVRACVRAYISSCTLVTVGFYGVFLF